MSQPVGDDLHSLGRFRMIAAASIVPAEGGIGYDGDNGLVFHCMVH